MVAAIKTPVDARAAYDKLAPDQQEAVHVLIAKGTPKLHALNLVRSQHMQDVAREGVQADDETRDPTQAEQLGAAGMGAADAATLGLADEGAAAVQAPYDAIVNGKNLVDAYKQRRDDARSYSEGKLGAAFGAGQLAGTAAQAGMGVGAGLAGVGTGLAGNAAEQGIKLGAATGALGGFGAGKGALESAKGALLGSITGSALGGIPGAVTGELAPKAAGAAGEAEASPAEAAKNEPASTGDGPSIVDVINRLRNMPPTAKAVLRHVPYAGKAINIADSLGELGLLGKVAPAAKGASASPAPELDAEAMSPLMRALGLNDPNAPTGASAANLADADLPPSMQVPRAQPATPATPSADWHFRPDGETPIPPEAQAEMDAIRARVTGDAATPPPSTASMRAVGKASPSLAEMGADVVAGPSDEQRMAALQSIDRPKPPPSTTFRGDRLKLADQVSALPPAKRAAFIHQIAAQFGKKTALNVAKAAGVSLKLNPL